MGQKVISLVGLNYNNNLPLKICYKNIMNVALFFFHNTFIFNYGWFRYEILLFYKNLHLNSCENIVAISYVNIFLLLYKQVQQRQA